MSKLTTIFDLIVNVGKDIIKSIFKHLVDNDMNMSKENLIAGAISRDPGTFKILKSTDLDFRKSDAPFIKLLAISL